MWKNDLIKYYDTYANEEDSEQDIVIKNGKRAQLLKQYSVEDTESFIKKIVSSMIEEEKKESHNSYESLSDDSLFEIFGKIAKILIKRRHLNKNKNESAPDFLKKMLFADLGKHVIKKKG